MARYKHIDTSPRFLAVDLQQHLLPGIFEHAMNHWIELGGYRYATKLDLTPAFQVRWNDGLGGIAVATLLLTSVRLKYL